MGVIESYLNLITEGARLGVQITKTALNLNDYNELDSGDSTITTIVIPGFMASNPSTYFLRRTLNGQGHNCIKWCNHRNMGFTEDVINETIDQVVAEVATSGGKVNIIGQSLGGCYARTVANAVPECINMVITLGSPITGLELVSRESIEGYNRVAGEIDAATIQHSKYLNTFKPNPPVPTTSIFSKSDGVVDWNHSIIDEGLISENIEVHTSHLAMGLHLKTVQIVANRLTQSPNAWVKWEDTDID